MADTQDAPRNEIVDFFVAIEKKYLKKWQDTGLTKQYLRKNDMSKTYFSFMDGPITANNPMGVHHAWGRTYKDLWQKFHNLKGSKQRFQNGFDCQGLWVEVEVEKELGLKSKKDIENLVPGDRFASIAKFVSLCRERVMKYSGIQTEQSKRLGYFMDWDHSYFTMSDDNNYMIWKFLKTCADNGWIYKGKDSVPWCPRCETAISQHEMLTEDYKDVVHESVYFKLHVQKDFSNVLPDEVKDMPIYFLAWTTTPWTIPGNVALGVNTDLSYVMIRVGDMLLILAEERLAAIHEQYTIIKRWHGMDLVGLRYTAPFDSLPRSQEAKKSNETTFHTVVDASLVVTSTEGTGILHIAPGQGKEDFDLGKKYHLPLIELIDDTASYFDGMSAFSGKNAKKHPELIINYLKTEGSEFLYKTEQYRHRYPACWRCKAELVWKVADEWYISMDIPGKIGSSEQKRLTLRQQMIEVAKQISWMPEFGLDRELDWLKNMHDWLISKKNRYWGLALPIYECVQCQTFEVIGSKDELKARVVAGWSTFEGHTPHKPYIDEVKIACKTCQTPMSRILDVGNPWLDAGIVPYSTIKNHNQGEPLYNADREEWRKWFPVDFITESFPGQFKNWFYAMIAMSTVLEFEPPFKRVLGFGTLLGEDGRPMHKSWGNSIAFHEGADEIGVDVMRWMYCRHNPAENLLFGPKRASEVRRQFLLLYWNIFKFYRDYAAIDGFDPKQPHVIHSEHILDTWARTRLHQTVRTTEQLLNSYQIKESALNLEEFISDMSTWYLRRSRERVGISAESAEDKQSFYQTMYEVLKTISIVLSPYMPFITDEIYTALTGEASVHLTSWPHIETSIDEALLQDMQIVRQVAETAHKVRKELKLKVRQPLTSMKVMHAKKSIYRFMQNEHNYSDLLKNELNVKDVQYQHDSALTEYAIEFDTHITPELQLEGDLRDLIREIQKERKALGASITDQIKLTIPLKFKSYQSHIIREVNAGEMSWGEVLNVSLASQSESK